MLSADNMILPENMISSFVYSLFFLVGKM
jgi:hypothetical protein